MPILGLRRWTPSKSKISYDPHQAHPTPQACGRDEDVHAHPTEPHGDARRTPFLQCVVRLHPVARTYSEERMKKGHRSATCRRGHAFDEANTRIQQGNRVCRRCIADRAIERYHALGLKDKRNKAKDRETWHLHGASAADPVL